MVISLRFARTDKINSKMIAFKGASTQNKEQIVGVQKLKEDFIAGQLENSGQFFIGRFLITKELEEKINRMGNENALISNHIARELGLPENSISISPSSGRSEDNFRMVKVNIIGKPVNDFINIISKEPPRLNF